MPSIQFAPSTRFITPAERRTLRSPPPKPKAAPSQRPPVPPLPALPLPAADSDADFTAKGQCLLVRGQPHVKPRNRGEPLLGKDYRPLVDGGANFQFKLVSLKAAQRRHSIVYREAEGVGCGVGCGVGFVFVHS